MVKKEQYAKNIVSAYYQPSVQGTAAGELRHRDCDRDAAERRARLAAVPCFEPKSIGTD